LENFHFAICASMVKGLTDTVTKGTAIRVLTTFLGISGSNTVEERKYPEDATCLSYVSLLLSRAMTFEESKEILWIAGQEVPDVLSHKEELVHSADLNKFKDKELLLTSAIGIIDFHYLEDYAQNKGLSWLLIVAHQRPAVILHLSGPIIRILEEVLLSCQNTSTLETAHQLLRTLTSNPKFSGVNDTAEMLEDVLDGLGFGGLWRTSTFYTPNEHERQCTTLTDKLIELIIA